MAKQVREHDKPKIVSCGAKCRRRHFVASAPAKNGIDIEENKRRQNEEEQKFEGNQLSEQFLASTVIPLPEAYRKHRGVSGTDKNAECAKKHHHRERERKPGHRVFAASASDVEPVHHRIECVQAHGHESRP